ncbi:hypothetical protein TA3x_003803 [Tundrisphaera sp. TA3]|uniref:hypothetical protein n=1 Tax=Tundrisphaera sp. TA3 TaxID=3435775 RepID=UPI003EBE0A2A
MFADSYRETFASFGIPLGREDACTEAEIAEAEGRLAMRLPRSLREYHLVAGREQRINQYHNRFLPPEKMFADSGHLVFMEENQRVVYWGIPADREAKPDAAVFQGVNRRGEAIDWYEEHESCASFLNVMAIWNASFGGAAANIAAGQVDEAATRAMLDGHWKFSGEVNAMRAYTQPGRAVCFLRYHVGFPGSRTPPPWWVFAAAASAGELDRLKASLPAQWEPWGNG